MTDNDLEAMKLREQALYDDFNEASKEQDRIVAEKRSKWIEVRTAIFKEEQRREIENQIRAEIRAEIRGELEAK